MKSIIVLLINGKNFFFEDENLTISDKNNLKKATKDKEIFSEQFIDSNKEEDICELYLKKVEQEFNIKLKRLNITEVLRI